MGRRRTDPELRKRENQRKVSQGTPRTRNPAEQELIDLMEQDGYKVFKRGWPDFFCEKDGELVLVEVKPDGGHRLKYAQHVIMAGLARYGVPCYFWCPDLGFFPADESDYVPK